MAEPTSAQCLHGVIYIDTTSVTGRTQLSLVLTAKALSKKLAQLAYRQDEGGLCWATTLEME
jgi:hypothetical protein